MTLEEKHKIIKEKDRLITEIRNKDIQQKYAIIQTYNTTRIVLVLGIVLYIIFKH